MLAERPKVVIAPAGGAFGTALSVPIAASGCEVTLAFRDDDKARVFGETHQIDRLPGVVFPDRINFTANTAQAAREADLIFVATPMRFLESYYAEQIRPFRKSDTLVVSPIKGITEVGDKYLRPTEVMINLDPGIARHIAVLSGPNFAREVARGLPVMTVIASEDGRLAEELVKRFASNPWFRTYASADMAGVELGGAFKNVIAIAAGVCDGRQFGESARAALIERGKKEIISLGMVLGGQRETLAEGLSGDADLWMTCTSKQSRNHEYGERIGQGGDPIEVLQDFQNERKTVEGFETARVAYELAKNYGIETPIIDSVYNLLHRGIRLDDVIRELMTRKRVYENGKRLTAV